MVVSLLSLDNIQKGEYTTQYWGGIHRRYPEDRIYSTLYCGGILRRYPEDRSYSTLYCCSILRNQCLTMQTCQWGLRISTLSPPSTSTILPSPAPSPYSSSPPLHTHAGIKADYRSGDLTPSFGSCNGLRKRGGWKRGGGGIELVLSFAFILNILHETIKMKHTSFGKNKLLAF